MNRFVLCSLTCALCISAVGSVTVAEDQLSIRKMGKTYDPDIFGLLAPLSVSDESPRGPAVINIGFEPGEGYVVGALGGQNGWTSAANVGGSVSAALPDTGLQHARFVDGLAVDGTLVTATSASAGAQAVAASSMSMRINISNDGGADYFILGRELGLNSVNIRFVYADFDGDTFGPDIAVVDLAPGAVFVATGTQWVPGVYKTVRADVIPAADQIDYYYDGVLIYRGRIWDQAGTATVRDTIDAVGIRHDSFQLANETCDVDNILVSALNATGACCDFVLGQCQDNQDANLCVDPNKTWYNGQTCLAVGCVEAQGACCLGEDENGDLVCSDGGINNCINQSGNFLGDGTTCANNACPPVCTAGTEGQLIDFLGHGATGTLGVRSDDGLACADNFTPTANGTLTSIRFWGVYINDAFNASCEVPGGQGDDFVIKIYNDALDVPFQMTHGPFNVTPAKEFTGVVIPSGIGDIAVWQFEVTGLNVPVQQDRCVWFEIVNDFQPDVANCDWFWSTGPAGDNIAAQGATEAYVSPADQLLFDLSWCIDVEIQPDGCVQAIELAGACCLNLGTSCDDTQGISACIGAGGVFRGTGTLCTGPQAVTCEGACCGVNGAGASQPGVCSVRNEQTCQNGGGVFQGIGSSCSPNPCDGRCCLSDGSCDDNGANPLSRLECEAQSPDGLGGSFAGGETCAGAQCSTFDICDPDGLPVLTCGASRTFNNLAQASEELDGVAPIPDTPDMSCFGGGASDGIGAFWLTFVGTGGDVEISTCGSEVSDTVIAVYTNPLETCDLIDALDEVACSEDDDDGEPDGVICPDPLQSRLCVTASVLGQTYYVQVTSFDNASVGNITVNMVCPCQVEATCACPGDVAGLAGPLGDGTLDGEDVQEFANCLVGTGTNCDCADVDEDGAADDEFGPGGDIEAFVSLLLNGATCAP